MSNFPEFLIADNSQVSMEDLFVVHTIEPRFIVKYVNEKVVDVLWQDAKPSEEAIPVLLAAAQTFYDDELDSQLDLADFED